MPPEPLAMTVVTAEGSAFRETTRPLVAYRNPTGTECLPGDPGAEPVLSLSSAC